MQKSMRSTVGFLKKLFDVFHDIRRLLTYCLRIKKVLFEEVISPSWDLFVIAYHMLTKLEILT